MTAPSKPGCDSRKGVALVMVLWLMVILSAVALGTSFVSRLRLQATRNSADGVRALFCARAGVEAAMAQLKADRNRVLAVTDLRESAEQTYQNVEVGDGSYTLFVGAAESGSAQPDFGIVDEAGKLNLNTATEEMLRKLPGMTEELAAGIVQLRQESDTLYDLADLLLLEGVDLSLLYGEDQNGNGLLDPNEDDGDESWPPDNSDGELGRGLAPYVTCSSAVRNVTSDGSARVNVNTAGADEITRGVSGINQQQADSIIEHRKNGQLGSIADLLDVMLVEKVEQSEDGQNGQQGRSSGQRNREEDSSQGGAEARGGEEGGSSGGTRDGRGQGERQGSRTGGSSGETQVRTTNKNAFSVEDLKRIADAVTTSDEETLQGVINVNTAPVQVLACLPGVEEELAVQIADARPETGFQSIGDLLDVPGLTTEVFKQMCGSVSVRSDVFGVQSFGVLTAPDGTLAACCCVWAVIDVTGDQVKLNVWRELR